jgi:hypothetical protein
MNEKRALAILEAYNSIPQPVPHRLHKQKDQHESTEQEKNSLNKIKVVGKEGLEPSKPYGG